MSKEEELAEVKVRKAVAKAICARFDKIETQETVHNEALEKRFADIETR